MATTAGAFSGAVTQGVDWSLSLLLIKALAIAILGGLDSHSGVLLAGVIVGVIENLATGVIDPMIGGGNRAKSWLPAIILLTLLLRPHGLLGREHTSKGVMFYRRAGIRHTSYRRRRLWLPFDRGLVALVEALLVMLRRSSSTGSISSAISCRGSSGRRPRSGSISDGRSGSGPPRLRRDHRHRRPASTHLVRAHAPFEIAILAGGLASTNDRLGVRRGGAARQGLYLAMATLAMQSIVDFIIVHVGWISGGGRGDSPFRLRDCSGSNCPATCVAIISPCSSA